MNQEFRQAVFFLRAVFIVSLFSLHTKARENKLAIRLLTIIKIQNND